MAISRSPCSYIHKTFWLNWAQFLSFIPSFRILKSNWEYCNLFNKTSILYLICCFFTCINILHFHNSRNNWLMIIDLFLVFRFGIFVTIVLYAIHYMCTKMVEILQKIQNETLFHHRI